MKKLLKNTNLLFIIAMAGVMLLHIYFLFSFPSYDDESHYLSVPFRLINGDSLVQEEWHLTQFASLFTYLPVKIWLTIKGSAEGLFLFSRCVYLAIHTAAATLIYRFFKEYGNWAIIASLMFFVQLTYGIQAISYHSMFVLFFLLLTLCLLSIYKDNNKKFYIPAGICYGCCCVCNPFFCFAFVLYLILCVLWSKKDTFKAYIMKKRLLKSDKGKKLTNKEIKEMKKQTVDSFPELENYNCFFVKGAILKFACGVAITAIIAIMFFFFTGGTISSIFNNIENLLSSSEYASQNILFAKIFETIKYFVIVNLYMVWILPALFIAMFFDKKRKSNSHRIAYLAVTILWMIIFIAGIIINKEIYVCAFSMPFSVFSLVCYMLTRNKNKPLFFCMYLPCVVASFFHLIAADTLLAAAGIVLAVSNIAGVIFAMDLWKEICTSSANDTEEAKEKNGNYVRSIIIVALCIQIGFYGISYQWGQFFYEKGSPKADTGPCSGLHMSENQYESYNKTIDDLNVIKELSSEKDPVLISSFRIWMYLHLDRPFATYTTWYRGALNYKLLANYYKANPEKIPRYIYLDATGAGEGVIQFTMDHLSEMFQYTSQELSNGVLLTVHFYNL